VHVGGTTEPSTEDNLSFYSGHTTLAFSVGVSSSLIAYRRRYRLAPAILISTLALGVTTAYLRMAADRHYFSDVLVGALAGTAGGYLIPQLGTRFGRRAAIVPTPNGIAITGSL
jgi:membrane-associated phospholipid phosphatase